MDLGSLILKYSTAGPRYTSYPTAPQWSETVGRAEYTKALEKVSRSEDRNLALYVHLPFCERLCYYCGCNIQVTHDRSRSLSYVEKLKQEISSVAKSLGARRRLSQMSWGGGTPTFLSVNEIRDLYLAIAEHFDFDPAAEISVEIDPRVTLQEQLQVLRSLGFNRASLGVQDFNPEVQAAINRIQPAVDTAAMLQECRHLGYEGLNFDLIYGLPLQSLASFEKTVDQVIAMRPDRIALYNYARLPSLLKHQAILEKFPMPSAEERLGIFLMALERLTAAGYATIGMDHFALREDGLTRALEKGTLYRNFMGYTVQHAPNLVGVGASAIGEVSEGFFQNIKKPVDYEAGVGENGLATQRGLLLTEDDRRRKWVIQRLMCQFEFDFSQFEAEFGASAQSLFAGEIDSLGGFESDGILSKKENGLVITELGRLFVRNVAMVFDAYLEKKRAVFSQTV